MYLHAHHIDVMEFLDTKRENADESIRIKTLSLGLVIPDITYELARRNEDMYLFSPYDVRKEYGIEMSKLDVTENYWDMVDNPRIRKKKVKAREFFQQVATIQFESGYPYIMNFDTVNRANPIDGVIRQSNLCVEILQVSEHSEMNEDGSYKTVGKDISCNLGSMNIAKAIDGGNLEETVEVGMRSLSTVSEISNIKSVPSIERGNQLSHAVGLGQMNLHGFLAREHIHYGSEKALEIVDAYFMTVAYYAYKASNKLAIEKGESFYKFEDSDYADGSYFNKYIGDEEYAYDSHGYFEVPSKEDWQELAVSIVEHGLYNQNLQAIPPTGSISYINGSTSSIHPIASAIETRKEGKLGRVYYPAAYMNMDNLEYYKDAYELGPEKLIDTYAMATKHVDQGLSCTLFLKAEVSTREVNKAQIYAWRKGLKTLYYIRLRQLALDGTAVAGTAQECIACAL